MCDDRFFLMCIAVSRTQVALASFVVDKSKPAAPFAAGQHFAHVRGLYNS